MKIIQLDKNPAIYTCNSYLILGDWNGLEDINTLIDPGTDGSIIEQIEQISTGCGKLPVQQIILTHNHFDHAGGVAPLKRRYGARVLAFSDGPEVDELLGEGQWIKAGNGAMEVIHTPEHSSDSICLFDMESGVLFSGDTQLRCRSAGESPSPESLLTLKKLGELPIQTAYTGHNGPIYGGILGTLRESLRILRTTAQKRKIPHHETMPQLGCA